MLKPRTSAFRRCGGGGTVEGGEDELKEGGALGEQLGEDEDELKEGGALGEQQEEGCDVSVGSCLVISAMSRSFSSGLQREHI